ncbi:SCO family protein [Haloferula chungangensis]|uniref:SCO family protein n=1 Tax=Haloferula chungangensis TaxID=1048331 RepID=A0ABW2LA82_9BACT
MKVRPGLIVVPPLGARLALTLLFLLTASAAVKAEEALPPCCAEKESAGEAEGSVYELDATWTNQHHKQVRLADFKDQPVLLTMGYASCQFACPRLVADLMAIERGLTAEQKKAIRIVFVSIDPQRDTPEKLAAFFKQYNLDQTRWSGLRGTEDAVLELSVALGTRYRKIDHNDFAHSNRLTLLSPDGVILHNQEGLGTDPKEMIAAIRQMLPPYEKAGKAGNAE